MFMYDAMRADCAFKNQCEAVAKQKPSLKWISKLDATKAHQRAYLS
jgi:hypothetical protein